MIVLLAGDGLRQGGNKILLIGREVIRLPARFQERIVQFLTEVHEAAVGLHYVHHHTRIYSREQEPLLLFILSG